MDEMDRKIISRLCGDIGTSRDPFGEIAAEMGIDRCELLARISSYRQSKAMRRFGAILRHTRAGVAGNAMSVWNVPEADIERVAAIMASKVEISHCYQRSRLPGWNYNLFAMLHAENEKNCQLFAEQLAVETGISDYQLLYSRKEFKKSSMVYFNHALK